MYNPLYDIVEAVSQASIGVIVTTNRTEALRQRLYPLLKEFDLNCRIYVVDEQLWIVHRTSAELG